VSDNKTLTTFCGLSGRIGLLGGSFDPVHNGHLSAADAAVAHFGLDRLVFIPAHRNPLKPQAAVARDGDRLRMLELAVEGHEHLFVSPLELNEAARSADSTPSYTVNSLSRIRSEVTADAKLYLLIGSDIVPDLHRWKDIDRIFTLAEVVPFKRAGWTLDLEKALSCLKAEQCLRLAENLIDLSFLEISSSAIRTAFFGGDVPSDRLPGAVTDYILSSGIYCTTSP
jgi:nicotinate-nucleotide adenylyltransferase